MGNFMDPSMTEVNRKQDPFAANLFSQMSDWFKNYQPDQMAMTPMGGSMKSALQSMYGMANQYGNKVGDYYQNLLQNGGIGDTNQLLAQQAQLDKQQRDQLAADISARTDLRGSAGARALSQGLGNLALQQSTNALGTQLNQQNLAENRKMGAASGLAGLPGIYGAPTSLEMAFMQGIQQPEKMANFQSQQNYNNLMGQYMMNAPSIWGNSVMYDPNMLMGPSDFDKYIAPFLNPLLQGVGKSLPFLG